MTDEARSAFRSDGDLADRLDKLDLASNAIELTLRGYTIISDAAPIEFFDRLRDSICASHRRAGSDVLVGMLLQDGRVFEEAVCNVKVVSLAEYMCGRGFLLSQVVGTVRGEGEGGLAIHTDYNMIRDPFPSYPLVTTAVWACDDFTQKGGCPRAVPTSYLRRRHPVRELLEGETDAAPILCKRGSVVMWDGATWHGSFPRRIVGERVALHVMYNRMILRTFEHYVLPQEVVDRNAPVFAAMLGENDPFGKSTVWGVDRQRTTQARQAYRS